MVASNSIVTGKNPLITAKDKNGVPIYGMGIPNNATDVNWQSFYLPADTEVTMIIPEGCNAIVVAPDSNGLLMRVGSDSISSLPTAGNPVLGVRQNPGVIAPVNSGDTLRMRSNNTTQVGLVFCVIPQL